MRAKSKSISKKITIHIVAIGLITFCLSLIMSYAVFVPMLTEKAVTSAESTNEEIVQLINKTVSFVESSTENLAVAVSQSEGIQNYFNDPTEKNKNIAMIMLSNLISREGLIRSVIIEPLNEPRLDSMNKIKAQDYEILDTQWYKNLHSLPYSRGFSRVYPIEIASKKYYNTVYVRNFYQDNHFSSFVTFISLNSMINEIKTISEGTLDYLALYDSESKVYYKIGNEKWGEEAEKLLKNSIVCSKDESNERIRFTKKCINSQFGLVSIVSRSSILKSLIPYFTGIFSVLTIFLLLTLTATTRSLKSFTKPITALSRNMQVAAKGNLECSVQIERDDEIGDLGKAFNKMLADLKSSINVIAEKEEQKQQTKFSLLISQINPHFIYNTINSINYLARKGKCDDVIEVNSALISILRDRLRVSDIQITDSIEQEIYVINQYMLIQRYMYDGNIQVEWEVDKELLENPIPKNLIQPLLENALFHGLIDEESGEISGIIKIKIWKEDTCIKISVSDNGVGMNSEKLMQVRNEMYSPDDRGKRIGISSIRSRLHYLYGDRECINITSEVGKGTTITLTIFEK